MISFVVAVLSFVWTTGVRTDKQPLPSDGVVLALRLTVTSFVGIGITRFGLAIGTFRRNASFRRNVTSPEGSSQSRDAEVEIKEQVTQTTLQL